MEPQPAASAAAPEDASALLAADGALFSYKFLLQMYCIGIVVFFILFYTHREEGYWLVCAPFFPAIVFAAFAHRRQQQHLQLKARSKASKQD